MIGAWTINVSGRVYGPFTSERMRGFVSEGRLAPHSLVAREGSADWHEARDEPEFSDVFAHRGGPAVALAVEAKAAPAAAVAQADPSPQPVQPPARTVEQLPQTHTPRANGASTGDNVAAHFAVIVDQKSQAAAHNIEGAINSLGQAYRLTNNVWIISTEQTVSAVRNRLVQELGKTDSLFVIDASRGKAAWFNFGPEADVRIRRVWQKTA
jgi:GYF domain 2